MSKCYYGLLQFEPKRFVIRSFPGNHGLIIATVTGLEFLICSVLAIPSIGTPLRVTVSP